MHRVELKEFYKTYIFPTLFLKFLMYRVELKEILGGLVKITHEKFLMYRVELKVCWTIFFLMLPPPFLMYRVELKELFPHPKKIPRLCSS